MVISRVLETDVSYTPAELDTLSEAADARVRRPDAPRGPPAAARPRSRGRRAEAGPDPGPRLGAGPAGAREEGRRGDRLFYDGTARLLEKPEFADVFSLKRIFQAFDEKARVLDLVSRYLDSPGTSVVLGSEDDHAVDPRLSAVLTSYGTGETLTGMLGVIGPARREYTRVIPVVELLGRAVSDRLDRREERPDGGAAGMSDRDRDGRPIDEDTLEVERRGRLPRGGPRRRKRPARSPRPRTSCARSRRTSRSSRTATCASSPSSRTTRSAASASGRSTSRSRSRASPTTSCPILDNFERALAHARPEDLESDFGQGIAIIRKQLGELWKRYGLIPIDTTGAFDPNLHEAVATEETESVPPNTIVEELQKGYFLNDRLIRPSFVKVAVRNAGGDDADASGSKT